MKNVYVLTHKTTFLDKRVCNNNLIKVMDNWLLSELNTRDKRTFHKKTICCIKNKISIA